MSHTPGELEVVNGIYLRSVGKRKVLVACALSGEDHNNAERLALCWNALERFTNEQILALMRGDIHGNDN